MSEIRPFANAPQISFNPRLILTGLIGLFLAVGIFSGVYQVPAESVAVVASDMQDGRWTCGGAVRRCGGAEC